MSSERRGLSDTIKLSYMLDLAKPIFEQTARFGHFGHADFAWEQ